MNSFIPLIFLFLLNSCCQCVSHSLKFKTFEYQPSYSVKKAILLDSLSLTGVFISIQFQNSQHLEIYSTDKKISVKKILKEINNKPNCNDWSFYISPFQRIYIDSIQKGNQMKEYIDHNNIIAQNNLINCTYKNFSKCGIKVKKYYPKQISRFIQVSIGTEELNQYLYYNNLNDGSLQSKNGYYFQFKTFESSCKILIPYKSLN